MKKTLLFFSALVALIACTKETPKADDPTQNGNQEIKVNFTIARSDTNVDTKGTVKTGWASGDVVFIFFDGVDAPRYLEMRYNGSTWDSEQKGGLVAKDLSASGTMTALYLPYGSNLTVSESEGSFVFSEKYSGYYYTCRPCYSFASNTLSGGITLAAGSPDTALDTGNLLVQFDVTGYAADHTYELFQDYMKPIMLTGISTSGVLTRSNGTVGDAIPGYIDGGNSIVSFSGVLDSSANGKEKSYWFSIRDTEDGTLYYRNIGAKTISISTAIGLKNLTSNWAVAAPGVFSVSSTQKITFARSNLYYRGSFEDAGKKWQLMKYPWSVIEGSSYTETSDIGYFAWGTSGWDNTVNEPFWINYQPWTYLTWAYPKVDATNFYGLGPSSPDKDHVKHLTDENANGDWGVYNTIYSYGGGALDGAWHTPSRTEYFYLCGRTSNSTDDAEHARYRMYGRVALNDGDKTIRGVVLIPDQSWVDPRSTTFKGTPNSYFNNGKNAIYGGEASEIGEEGMESSSATNYYTMVNWNKMEAAGAVLLPMDGYRDPGLQNLNAQAAYWSSTSGFNANIYDKAYALTIESDGVISYLCSASLRRLMLPVRLVRDVE